MGGKTMYSGSRFLLRILAHPSQRRHVLRWLLSFRDDYFLRKRRPWLVFDAIAYLDSLSLSYRHVFEYGSGGSTLYWLSRNAQVVSIEHDQHWFQIVSEHCRPANSLDYRWIPPRLGGNTTLTADPADPDGYTSTDTRWRRFDFYDYVSQIDAFPDAYFDVVLIDGRARPSCIKHSISKVQVGGLIVLDNAEIEHYLARTRDLLRSFDEHEFFGIGPATLLMWKTVIFVRRE
jgi:hypothetical protein